MNTAALISRLHQALVAEARRSYPNVQGQRARFSEFAFEQLGLVSDELPHAPDLQNRIADFRRKLKRYDDLNPIERSMVVDGLIGALSQFTRAQYAVTSPPSTGGARGGCSNSAPQNSAAATSKERHGYAGQHPPAVPPSRGDN